MIIRKWHKFGIAALRGVWDMLISSFQNALHLSGIIEIKLLQGFYVVYAGNLTLNNTNNETTVNISSNGFRCFSFHRMH